MRGGTLFNLLHRADEAEEDQETSKKSSFENYKKVIQKDSKKDNEEEIVQLSIRRVTIQSRGSSLQSNF